MRRTLYLLIPVVWLALTVLHLHQVRISNEQLYLNYETRLQSQAFSTSLQRYEMALQIFLSETIRRPDISTLIAQIQSAEGAEQQHLRQRLFEQLTPVYERLHQFNIDQLHVHTADGHSLLRLHGPDQYGDFLLPYRPSLGQVQRQLKPLFLFEVGRLFIGFRHIEPLFDDGRLIATLEAGVSFDRVREVLEENSFGTLHTFLLRRDPVEAVALDFYRDEHNLTPSRFGADYLMLEDNAFDQSMLAGEPFSALSEHLARDPELVPALELEEPFTLGIHYEGRYFTSSFIPIRNVEGALAAWAVSFSPSPLLQSIYEDYYQGLLLGMGVLIFISALLLILARKHAALSRQSRSMDAISDAVGEGIFVIDAQGRAAYVNKSACELTGYSRETLMQADIHALIHDHDQQENSHCPILATLASGKPYNGDERFRHADGHVMTVVVTSRALYEKGRITGVVTVFRDISERKELEQRLELMATVDELTGLLNRRALVELIGREIQRIRRTQQPGVLLMMDFDHFKVVNDRYGHDAGDRVLHHVAQIARGCLRQSDTLGRLGGEEFAALLPNTSLEGALVLAERLRAQVAAAEIQYEDARIRITLSIGVYPLSAADQSVSDALRRVDRALYRAKAQGRNRIEVA